ncbi:uncharacterized protein LOC111357830 [Spodoptera litura]|uniref:Uncharacterized protein LOC111357830 n=1 Tax=Spodoptera litura TaxID=69820 RepID=A0A9J7IWQ0_SPOLT|nr:uncharacterized protein LOC111357830 [Spodoptera litura]
MKNNSRLLLYEGPSFKTVTNAMSNKVRGRSNIRVTLDTAGLYNYSQSHSLLGYTALTFIIVFLIYLATKDWKGYTSPEEVDLGTVQVPTNAGRRKQGHLRRQD